MRFKRLMINSIAFVFLSLLFCFPDTAVSATIKLKDAPQKVFSPEDGEWVYFNIDNPEYVEVNIKIFDISGSEVRKSLTSSSDTVQVWDGKNDSDEIVSGGVYIYQLEAGDSLINGAIVVTK